MRTRWLALVLAAMFFGALGGTILAPTPAGAISKEMIELQQQVAQILQTQQELRSAIDTNSASVKTLVQQSLDSVNKLSGEMGTLQKAVQEVQANTGARIDTMTQQTQGLSDNLQDVQARVGKLSQQLTDVQNLLQSIDAKVSGGATGAPTSNPIGAYNPGATTGGTSPAGGMPPISADTLYQNALRDYTSGKYDLAHQEFSDYIRNFPSNDLASNAQFYLGEVAYAQGDFKSAIASYDNVLVNYPKSFKLAASLLKKGLAELETGLKASGTRDLREVIRRFPGSDEARRAQAKLHEIGAAPTSRTR
ncbi:MAG: tol-pal system protein YbgF [Acidobacteriia bacterium]|nr:tol-pal system protein YbgF [Terriglobia bacterium]